MEMSPVSVELRQGSDKLFLFFGGIVGSIGMPPFEFYQASKILEFSRVFVRDLSQSWYQRGLPGIGSNAADIGGYLNGLIKNSGASEIIFVGNSMGGYAALLFCAMLKTGKAVVFSPQTFLSTDKRQQYDDRRWPSQITLLHQSHVESDIVDLKEWIRQNAPDMKANVYVSTLDVLDTKHADELTEFANIRIHRFHQAGHSLVTKLRDDGMLAQILRAN